MIVSDVNLLLYAYDSSSPQHDAARGWFEESLSGPETVGFAWVTLLAFLRLATSPRVFFAPFTIDEALGRVDDWLAVSSATVLHPGPRHSVVLRQLLEPLGAAANLTTDAHLAALAVEHDAELCSADHDFSRFPGLRWRNPLVAR